MLARGSSTSREWRVLDRLARELPPVSHCRFWAGIELFGPSGGLYEADAIALGHYGVYVIELKDFTGRITGDDRAWTITSPGGSARLIPNPIQPAMAKARLLTASLAQVVSELVFEHAVPHLSALRHTEAGLAKRAAWESTWALQQREDAGDDVAPAPVPPGYAYGKRDYRDVVTLRHRGKLDVPTERFIGYPSAAPDCQSSL
ncbi:uncharacterized protein SOCEGT47_014190 [Sorangium cellulosum]|uniref:NERD domain-containing protein n=1 Tax=Sorangium cellulosum TaxID=56 RepID=A0A4V0ND00_SORCE|nr:uncharacterized protein SOCEGT47_014190 [Sorangium cellulosum]